MARRWLNNGEPLNGKYVLEIDPEDGTQPLKMYGSTKEEALEKAADNVVHGQRLINRLRQERQSAPTPARPEILPPAQPKKLTADEQMTATADLQNPAKAPQAIVKLVEHATGVDLKAQANRNAEQRLAAVAEAWSANHPEFPKAITSQKLLLNTAVLNHGIHNVTAEVLEQTYRSLVAQGCFTEVDASQDDEDDLQSTQTPPAPAGGSSPRTEVRRSATTYRASGLRGHAPTVVPKTQKYTKAQVDAMSSDELAEKYKTEPGFADLVASYQTPKRASA